MGDSLEHRGPDVGACWFDEGAGVAFGHRRLSIVDLSPAGHQPMTSADGRFVIVYNGEIYNADAVRLELEQAGRAPPWRGHSDTEVLLAAISAWGVRSALERCVGMFAFALWDAELRALTLVRDRVGEKPLYYAESRGVLLFGSELKALHASGLFSPSIDRGSLALFMRHGYVPGPRTIYADVHKLRPGTMATWREGRPGPEMESYWSALDVALGGQAATIAVSEQEAEEQLEQLLRQSIRGQLVADVPVGAFLSGGIDSSAVVALMQRESRRPVRTFSIGFAEDAFNEAHHAREVARHLGTDHTELYVSPQQALDVVPLLPAMYDEPFGDSSQVPTYLVSQLARQAVTVSLSGDAGDELFGGYNRYVFAQRLFGRLGSVPLAVRGVAARALRSLNEQTWATLLALPLHFAPVRFRVGHAGQKVHKLAEVLATTTLESTYLRLVSQWNDPLAIVPGTDEPSTILSAPSGPLQALDAPSRMMYLDLVTYLPDDILVKVDRAAMAVSLETRVPLLDHRLVEFAWQLPVALKMSGETTKRVLRRVLHRHVPAALVERPKMGFGVPIDHWLRGPLKAWAAQLLEPARLERTGLLRAAPVTAIWNEHQSGQRNWQYALWNVLMFQAWLERWHGE
jgi:asparagine synthase (glutamine-hydrolysing)